MGGRIQRGEPSSRLGLPIIGKIKIGMVSEKGYPQSLDWFRADGKYASMFHDVYGPNPERIQIVFPSDDAEKVCNEKYEYRDNAGKLIGYGDGVIFHVWDGNQYAPYSTENYPDIMNWTSQTYPSKTGWKVTLVLTFLLPMVRGIAGCWQLQTKGSASSIPSVRDAFDEILASNGKVSGVIFDLSVKFAKSQKPGQSSKFPVLTLVANEGEENIRKITEARKPIMIAE